MANLFDITTPSETTQLDVKGRSEVSFTITNRGTAPVRGRVKVVPLKSAKETWFSIDGELERDFSRDGSHQFTVRIAVPSGTPPSQGAFRLDIASVTNPDDDFSQGPSVSFEVKATEKQPFPMWLIPVLVVLLVVCIAGVWWVTRPSNVEVPKVTDMPYDDAVKLLTEKGFKATKGKEIPTDEDPPGYVQTQKPGEKELVPPGTEVTLDFAVPKPVEFVDLPDLVKLKIEEAHKKYDDIIQILETKHELSLDKESWRTIKDQDPPYGKDIKVKRGRPVAVTLWEEGTKVPPLRKKTTQEARLILEKEGLHLGDPSEELDASIPAGCVIRSKPPEGEKVPRGTRIAVVLAELKVRVPRLVDKSLQDAERDLNLTGLRLGTTTRHDGTTPKGKAGLVKSQSLAVDQFVPQGTVVNVVYYSRFLFNDNIIIRGPISPNLSKHLMLEAKKHQ